MTVPIKPLFQEGTHPGLHVGHEKVEPLQRALSCPHPASTTPIRAEMLL